MPYPPEIWNHVVVASEPSKALARTALLMGWYISQRTLLQCWLSTLRLDESDYPMDHVTAVWQIKQLLKYNYKFHEHSLDWAAARGTLEVVKWLSDNSTEGCTTYAMDMAAAHGHLCVVEWLSDYRTEGCGTFAMDEAACNGHLEIVQWLNKNRTEGCTKWAMNWAAKNGHDEVVKWLYLNTKEGCVASARNFAADNGHDQIAKWLGTKMTSQTK